MVKGSDYQRIEKAIHFLSQNVQAQPSLKDLSGFLGLSEFHSHRLFKKWAGITPKDFIQVLTLTNAKRLLNQSQSLLDVSLNTGLSGPSRLHDLFIRYESMTPGQFKSGAAQLEIFWDFFETPVGFASLAATHRGICSLGFFDSKSTALSALRASWPKAKYVRDAKVMAPWASELLLRMEGKRDTQFKLLVSGTPFQVKVWQALLNIPEGQVTTYAALANLIGSPRAVRAVGSAVGANPIGYLIPCHRVIKSTGAVGEYHWGTTRKTALLALETWRKNEVAKD